MTTDPPPISVFTFFLTLPYPLPVPDESTPGTVEERTPEWDEWTPDLVGRLVGASEPLADGVVPGTRMAIRHREVTMSLSPATAFDAFKDWIEPPLPSGVVERLRRDVELGRENGMRTVISVVALSRFIPRATHPRGDHMTVGWLLGILRPALADLNGFLEALGLVAQRWDIGTLAPRSLPFMVPLLVESTHLGPSDEKQGATAMVTVHDARPVPPRGFETKDVLLTGAQGISNAANSGDQPYMLVLRLIHGAEGERLAGDPTKAMIDLNTAIEVLVSVTISEAGKLIGWGEERISKAISWRTGLKRRVSDHLAEILREPIDVKDDSGPWGRWFVGGYLLRNAAVHEGRRLHKAEVDDALDAAAAVLHDLRVRLSTNEAFADLASKLEIGVGFRQNWEAESAGLVFPWD